MIKVFKNVNTMKKVKEFEKYLEKIEDPNYSGSSWTLPENPTALGGIWY